MILFCSVTPLLCNIMMIVWCKNIKNIDFDSEFEMNFACLTKNVEKWCWKWIGLNVKWVYALIAFITCFSVLYRKFFYPQKWFWKADVTVWRHQKMQTILILSYKVWEVASYVFYDPWYIYKIDFYWLFSSPLVQGIQLMIFVTLHYGLSNGN